MTSLTKEQLDRLSAWWSDRESPVDFCTIPYENFQSLIDMARGYLEAQYQKDLEKLRTSLSEMNAELGVRKLRDELQQERVRRESAERLIDSVYSRLRFRSDANSHLCCLEIDAYRARWPADGKEGEE